MKLANGYQIPRGIRESVRTHSEDDLVEEVVPERGTGFGDFGVF